MRRVIDDKHYETIAQQIADAFLRIDPASVSEYSYGTWRSRGSKIKSKVLEQVPNIKFGRDMNTTGIGNNECYEIIYTGNKEEEEICGLIHLTDNMYGSTSCWVSDYDNKRSTHGYSIPGREPRR